MMKVAKAKYEIVRTVIKKKTSVKKEVEPAVTWVLVCMSRVQCTDRHECNKELSISGGVAQIQL